MQKRLSAADLAKCFTAQDISRRVLRRLARATETFASGESLEGYFNAVPTPDFDLCPDLAVLTAAQIYGDCGELHKM